MSFSGRRLSILRPSGRRFSVGKELSENGASSIALLFYIMDYNIVFIDSLWDPPGLAQQ